MVSVVVPAYDAEVFLSKALESVLTQTYPHVECIVVDDGSRDSTPEIVHSYETIRYHRIDHSGVAVARNFGASLAKGEFIAFLDADDLWLPEKLWLQIQELVRSPSAALIYTGIHVIDEWGRFRGRIVPPSSHELVPRLGLIECQGIALGSTGLVRRSSFLDVAGFDSRMSTSADWDLAFRLACRYPVVGLRNPLVLYRRHSRQMHVDPHLTERDMRLFIEKMQDDANVPRALRRNARRAHANLQISLAGRCKLSGDGPAFLSHVARAFLTRPDRVLAAAVRLSKDYSTL